MCHVKTGAERGMVRTHAVSCGDHQAYLSETPRVWLVALLAVPPEQSGQELLKFGLVYQPGSHLSGQPGKTQPPQVEVTKHLLLPEEMQTVVQSILATEIRHFIVLCNAGKIAFCILQYLHCITVNFSFNFLHYLFLTD